MANQLIRTDHHGESIVDPADPLGTQDEEYCLVPSSDARGQHLKCWAKDCNDLVSLNNRLCQQRGELRWAMRTNHLVRTHCFFAPDPSSIALAEMPDSGPGGTEAH